MYKLSNSAMLLDIEAFLKQEIAEKIKTCPSVIKILSISCIDQQWSEQVNEYGLPVDDDDEDEAVGYEQRATRKVEWRLNYFDGSGMVKGNVYTAELLSQWTENIHESQDYVHMSLGKAEAETLIQELTVLAEVNLEAAKNNLF
jgi:hypothetical protein